MDYCYSEASAGRVKGEWGDVRRSGSFGKYCDRDIRSGSEGDDSDLESFPTRVAWSWSDEDSEADGA